MTSPAGEEPRPSREPGGSSRPVWAGLIVLAVLAVASLYHRSCYIDDAWLGERAYWLAREDLEFSGWSDSALASSGSNYRRIYEDETHLILELF